MNKPSQSTRMVSKESMKDCMTFFESFTAAIVLRKMIMLTVYTYCYDLPKETVGLH